MRLSRRDALAALAATGVATGGGAIAWSAADEGGGTPIDRHALDTLVSVAFVLYPSEVDGVDRFVERYVRGRVANRPRRAEGMADAVGYLDDYAAAWHGRRFVELAAADRDDALRGMSADTAEPDPTGSNVERVRYYVVNELLFALYSTPTGGDLLGIENPPGYPGGIVSYQRGVRR